MNITAFRQIRRRAECPWPMLPLIKEDGWRRTFCCAGPVIALISRGRLAIRRGGTTTIADAGDTVLLGPGTIDLEAFPQLTGMGVEVRIAEFSMAVLGDILREAPAFEALALCLPEEKDTGIYVQDQTFAKLRPYLESPESLPNLREVVNLIIQSVSATAIRFVRNTFFRQRWSRLMFMENHALRVDTINSIANNYPGGADCFYRDCRTYLGSPPSVWLRRRRMEIGRHWLTHSAATIEEVAKSLGYKTVLGFEIDFRKVHELPARRLIREEPWKKMTDAKSAECLRPFWWPKPLPLSFPDVPEPDLRELDPILAAEFERMANPTPVSNANASSESDDAGGNSREASSQQSREEVAAQFWSREPLDASVIVPFPTDLPAIVLNQEAA